MDIDWANARLRGPRRVLGGIRYGEDHEEAHVRDTVNQLHGASAVIAEAEELFDGECQSKQLPRCLRRRLGQVGASAKQSAQLHADLREHFDQILEKGPAVYIRP